MFLGEGSPLTLFDLSYPLLSYPSFDTFSTLYTRPSVFVAQRTASHFLFFFSPRDTLYINSIPFLPTSQLGLILFWIASEPLGKHLTPI